jgi:hypothetical protein
VRNLGFLEAENGGGRYASPINAEALFISSKLPLTTLYTLLQLWGIAGLVDLAWNDSNVVDKTADFRFWAPFRLLTKFSFIFFMLGGQYSLKMPILF